MEEKSLMQYLEDINTYKEAIKNAINEKGGEHYMDNVSFSGYAEKIKALQFESGDTPSTPTPSADYIYSNGYIEGGTQDIMIYTPYEITELNEENKFIIELFAPVELYGWESVSCPDVVFGVDVPTKYEMIDIEVWDSFSNNYNTQGFKPNIRHTTVVRDGVTYNSYLRNTDGYYESGDVMGDPDAPSYKYRITIKLI